MDGWEFIYYTNTTEISLSHKGVYSEPIFCFEQCGFAVFYISAKELYALFTAYVNDLPLPSTIRLFREAKLGDGLQFAIHTEDMLIVLNGDYAGNRTSFRIWDNAANKAILIYKEMYGG